MIKFSALCFRMKYIERWGLMRSSRRETLAEHAADTAMLAHLLAAAAKTRFGGADVRPQEVAAAALYHDCSEIITGDMPTPVKYRAGAAALTQEYKKLEQDAARSLLGSLPADISAEMESSVLADGLRERERQILKAADKLSALIKCVEEERFGNSEFKSAKKSTLAALRAMRLPEVDFFLHECLPAHALDLDELLAE